jgi:uncharacterized protein YqeY
MSLSKKIDEDIKNAMRAKDAETLGTLRMLKSAVKNVQIDKAGTSEELPDAEVITVIRKMIKQREDSVDGFVKGGRTELADKERSEIKLLSVYLPAAMSAAEVADLVRQAIAEAGDGAQMGAIMKIAGAKAAGRVDGKTLNVEVQKQLK